MVVVVVMVIVVVAEVCDGMVGLVVGVEVVVC